MLPRDNCRCSRRRVEAGPVRSTPAGGNARPARGERMIAVNTEVDHSPSPRPRLVDRIALVPRASISSGEAALALAYWGPYAVSKAALETLARTYAAETATTHVRVNVLTPGPVRTRMRAQAMPGEDPMGLEPPENVAEKIVELCLPD